MVRLQQESLYDGGGKAKMVWKGGGEGNVSVRNQTHCLCREMGESSLFDQGGWWMFSSAPFLLPLRVAVWDSWRGRYLQSRGV